MKTPRNELESAVEKRFVRKVKALGGKAYKFVSPNNRSVPDRVVVWPSYGVHFIELKQAGKNPTSAQWEKIEELSERNAVVLCIAGHEEVDLYLEDPERYALMFGL